MRAHPSTDQMEGLCGIKVEYMEALQAETRKRPGKKCGEILGECARRKKNDPQGRCKLQKKFTK